MYKGTAGGWAVQFSAARDAQVAADTAALSGTGTHTGAGVFAFIQAIETYGTSLSYDAMLRCMLQVLQSVNPGAGAQLGLGGGGGGGGGLMATVGGALSGLFDKLGMSGQTPMLSSNLAFDLSTPLMI